MPRIPPRTGSIKKGEKRNPKGSSAKARALKNIRRMTGDDLADLTSLLLTGNFAKLLAIGKDENSTIMQRITAKMLVKCHNEGDVSIYKAILDRVVGKPKEDVRVSAGPGGPIPLLTAQQTEEEVEERLQQIREAKAEVQRQQEAKAIGFDA